ncbi:uncharacterized protein LOC143127770 [Alosa pseudoharengus]|uniref:uncharacterized protein LOC143127770 n=1 Tax=Alosa pseudoharengus TaxID=34774 RepID=UPI003F8AE473
MATAKGPRTQRYRPASEFDNATLAKKREYWRTKKREQRAKVSAVRKKLGAENSSVCDARRNTFGAHVQNAASGPMLLNRDGTYQSNVCDPSESGLLTSSCGERVVKTGESEVRVSGAVPGSSPQNVSPAQNVRWFQRIKLNKVLPKIPEGSDAPQGSAMGCRKMATTGPSVVSNTLAKSSRSLQNINAPVPAVHVTVHPAITVNHRTPSRIEATNRTTSVKVYSHSLPQKGKPGLNDHKRPQVRVQIPHKAVPLSVTNKVGVDVKQCSSEVGSANIKTKPCALATKFTSPLERQTPKTEEQRAAKRREVWRIKKREQRAKRAAKLARERERIQRMDVTVQGTVQTSCATLTRPRLLRQGQRQAVNQARMPCVPASQMQIQRQQQNQALALSGPSPKSTPTAIRKQSDGPLLSNHIGIDPQPPAVVKTGVPKQTNAFYAPSAATSTCVVSNNMNLEQGFAHAPKEVTAQFSNTARGTARPKIQINKFVRTQRFLVHRNTRMPHMSFHENPEETAEQRMARKREYWRIKKREQRAKLSGEMKARLRERDSLLRRVKRYQSILEEMRRARAESQRVQQLRRNIIIDSSEPIGGYIREDGTVTISMQTTSSAKGTGGVEKLSPSKPLLPTAHCKVFTNKGCGSFSGHMNLNPPPLQKGAVQLRSSYPDRMSVQEPPKLVCITPRLLTNNLHNKFTNSSPSTSQMTVSAPDHNRNIINDTTNFKRIGNVARPFGTVPVAAEPTPELTEEERIARRREYWRIKKREQRAKRAARLRQGLLRGRAMAAMRRRQNHTPVSIPSSGNQTTTNSSVPVNTSTTLPLPPSICIPLPAESVKQEQELSVKEELNSPLEQSFCSDQKPSLAALQELPSETDPSGSVDSQATTLLAVASMKKLLEESLSTVVSSDTPEKSITMEASQCKTEEEPLVVEESTTSDVKPNPALDAAEEVVEVEMPGSICFSAEDAHLQTNDNSGCHTCPLTSPLLPNPHCSQESPPCIDTRSLPDIMASSASIMPASLCSTQQPPCSQTSTTPTSAQTVQAFCSTRANLQPSCSLKTSSHQPPGTEVPNEKSNLQRKREYWRLMKRQQRARKAQEKQRKPATKALQTQRPSQSSCSKASLPLNNSASSGCTLKGKTHHGTVNSLPTLHVMNHPVSNTNQQQNLHQYGSPSDRSLIAHKTAKPGCSPRANLQGHPSCGRALARTSGSREVPPLLRQRVIPVPSGEKNGPLLMVQPQQDSAPDQRQGVSRWCLQVQTGASVPPSPTLTANRPNHRPSELFGTAAPPSHNSRSLAKHSGTFSSHKRTQSAVNDDDVMRRKREYWRVKKKEQRARKAARESGLGHMGTSSEWELVLPTQSQLLQDEQSQDSRQWFKAEETDLAVSSQVDTDEGYLGMHPKPVKEEAELAIKKEEEDVLDPSGGPASASAWRSRYLMDYDPLNQLLVCMVCGEQQFSHSPEAAQAHIEEAHPETLTLGQQQRWKLQQAWEEQVAQREQFFSSQLQQHAGTTQPDNIAEVEVTVEMDDSSQSIYNKSAKSKKTRKF